MIKLPFQEEDDETSINVSELSHRDVDKHGAKQATYDIPVDRTDQLDVQVTKDGDDRIVISVSTKDRLLLRVNIDKSLLGHVLDIHPPTPTIFNTSKPDRNTSGQGQRRKKKQKREAGLDMAEHNPTKKKAKKKRKNTRPTPTAATPRRSNQSSSSFERTNIVYGIALDSSASLPAAGLGDGNDTDTVQAQASPQNPPQSEKYHESKTSLSPRRRPKKNNYSSDSSLSISDLSNAIEEELRNRQNRRRRSLKSLHHSAPPTTANRGALQGYLDRSAAGGETTTDNESVAGKSMRSARPIQQRRLQQKKLQRATSLRGSRAANQSQPDGPMYQSLPAIPFQPIMAPSSARPSTSNDVFQDESDQIEETMTNRQRLRRQISRRRNYPSEDFESTPGDAARQQRLRRQQRRERRRQQVQAYHWAQENRATLEQVAAENTRSTSSLTALWKRTRPTKWIGSITRKIQAWRDRGEYSFAAVPTNERSRLLPDDIS